MANEVTKLTHEDRNRELEHGEWKLISYDWYRWRAKFIFSDGSYIEGADPDAMQAIHSAIRIFDRSEM